MHTGFNTAIIPKRIYSSFLNFKAGVKNSISFILQKKITSVTENMLEHFSNSKP